LRAAQWFVTRLAFAAGSFAFFAVVSPRAGFHQQGQVSDVSIHTSHEATVQPIKTRIAFREFVVLDSHAQAHRFRWHVREFKSAFRVEHRFSVVPGIFTSEKQSRVGWHWFAVRQDNSSGNFVAGAYGQLSELFL